MYRSIEQLPGRIRKALPAAVQEYYLAAFNRTWEKLAAGDEAITPATLEAAAHKAAKSAVESEFSQKPDGSWTRDPVGEDVLRRDRQDEEPET